MPDRKCCSHSDGEHRVDANGRKADNRVAPALRFQIYNLSASFFAAYPRQIGRLMFAVRRYAGRGMQAVLAQYVALL